ncbi:amino acid synthesis family protein [Gordonia sp. zg691]|uniref:amino acid synthesis family protein n=1 Tax=Gordonia jinghuaiqii TaxID=2758710 RepID=UPI0016626C62|nr:amino acid synthesis family protein [Gordonia jinghuaiqii]MBD0862596.1 amino acid synthesis family protein [Gordonia jinghuaiqii]
MSDLTDVGLIRVRKRTLSVETIYHEFGPPAEQPVRLGSAIAVIANPFAGQYVEDLTEFMTALRPLGASLAQELIDALGGSDQVQAYGKASIVGINGELEHGAVWHEAGGWAMREALGDPKAMVPSAKAVANPGYRMMVPLGHIHAAYVRSHYNVTEVGVQDAPRPNEILFALVMADNGRIHSRLGGLAAGDIAAHDGLR